MDRLTRFSWFVLAYNLAVILWGAVVRATGSGAGCGNHWPLCNGVVVPRAAAIETLIEFSHRATSGVALILVVALAGLVFRSRPKGHLARLGAVLSVAFIFTEAAVGAGLVLFRLVADNQSMARALFMATHLVNTFLLLASLALTAHWAGGGRAVRLGGQGAVGLTLAAGFVATILVGTSGAIAALGDTLFPATSLADALKQDLSPTGHLLIRLRMLHPAIAILAAVVLVFVAWLAPHLRPSVAASRYGRWLTGLVFAQVLAGFANVGLLAPVWLQVIHLFIADLVWITLVLLSATALAAPGATAE
jgi:heme A synthase